MSWYLLAFGVAYGILQFNRRVYWIHLAWAKALSWSMVQTLRWELFDVERIDGWMLIAYVLGLTLLPLAILARGAMKARAQIATEAHI